MKTNMFYEPDKDNHGLPFNPYKSIVVPRPIGWISTISRAGGMNLALTANLTISATTHPM
jgi:flavin reductase (DIM6/NTAB) family NADH-FMN oxidoreductase RutF